MTMTVGVAALRIERDLKQLEDAIDAAIAAQGALNVTLVQARVDTSASAIEGHVALMRLAKAGQSLVTARTDAIRAHEELYKVGQERGDMPAGPKPSSSIERFNEAAAA